MISPAVIVSRMVGVDVLVVLCTCSRHVEEANAKGVSVAVAGAPRSSTGFVYWHVVVEVVIIAQRWSGRENEDD